MSLKRWRDAEVPELCRKKNTLSLVAISSERRKSGANGPPVLKDSPVNASVPVHSPDNKSHAKRGDSADAEPIKKSTEPDPSRPAYLKWIGRMSAQRPSASA